jgi:hypothetical protein
VAGVPPACSGARVHPLLTSLYDDFAMHLATTPMCHNTATLQEGVSKMAIEFERIDVSNEPALLRLAREVLISNKPRVLTDKDGDLVEVRPAQPARRTRATSKGLTKEDSFWDIVGIGHSGGSGDVASNKHKYLAEAYADPHK